MHQIKKEESSDVLVTTLGMAAVVLNSNSMTLFVLVFTKKGRT